MLGTHHFSLVVGNLDRSVDFYQGTLGMELVGKMDRSGEDVSRVTGFDGVHFKVAFLKLPKAAGVSLELMEYLHPTGRPVELRTCNPGTCHLCFKVDDIQSVYETLRARGVQFRSEPVYIGVGMNKGASVVYFQDPDGITLELFQPPS